MIPAPHEWEILSEYREIREAFDKKRLCNRLSQKILGTGGSIDAAQITQNMQGLRKYHDLTLKHLKEGLTHRIEKLSMTRA